MTKRSLSLVSARFGGLALPVCVVAGLAGCGSTEQPKLQVTGKAEAALQQRENSMSAYGRLASLKAAQISSIARGVPYIAQTCEQVLNDDCGGDDRDRVGFDGQAPQKGLAETSIAVDRTGRHVVIGYNDTRGFIKNPISVSGFSFSDDGGKTFTDGGQLPSPGDQLIGTTKLPQVFGDPDVRYIGDCSFIYSSILLKKLNSDPADGNVVQTMSIHRSTDCGHTWTGPFEVTAATNPNGQLGPGGAATDSADKEFIDVDPDTGRVMMSWTNFGAKGAEIGTTFSDDIQAATPHWSTRVVVAATNHDGQASLPRFAAHGSDNVYVAWRRSGTAPLSGNIGFARSTDNGLTFSPPGDIVPDFFFVDQILGNDRVNISPSLAVDNSRGRHSGSVYVVYEDNDSHDTGDVAFVRSTDQGTTWSKPLLINARPGQDRGQWFPWVTVDNTSGRVYVFYYDQGIATSGELSETTYTWSDDGGVHWSRPRPLTTRPFQAGWGNDSGQPNLGDYNQAIARDGQLMAIFAQTHPVGFTDGEPANTGFSVPDVTVKLAGPFEQLSRSATVRLGDITFRDSDANGNIDPNELVELTVPLVNYVTNPLNAVRLSDLGAFLTTSTPGVTLLGEASFYPSLKPGDTKNNVLPFIALIAQDFVPGTAIELQLNVFSFLSGFNILPFTLKTGTPSATTLLAESFDETTNGSLPAGWTSHHGGGANVVPWVTSSSFCGATSPAAFHADAIDGPANGSPARWERLFSPVFTVPADSEYLTVELDVCYDTEDDPNFNVLAYDGGFLRLTDLTTGHMLRSVLVEAFHDGFTTGALQGYPKHFPRNNDPAYFEDMSAWSGDSSGWKHVKIRLPGAAGTTTQLRFEYTQDSGGTCADVRPGHNCGFAVDNIVVNSVKSVVPSVQ
jgi:hypothetical protein